MTQSHTPYLVFYSTEDRPSLCESLEHANAVIHHAGVETGENVWAWAVPLNIAANAPELLAALILLVDEAAEQNNRIGSGTPNPGLRIARAAIAKATYDKEQVKP